MALVSGVGSRIWVANSSRAAAKEITPGLRMALRTETRSRPPMRAAPWDHVHTLKIPMDTTTGSIPGAPSAAWIRGRPMNTVLP